jgi:hypothetical protein
MNKSATLLLILLLLTGIDLKAQDQPFKPGDMVVGVFEGIGSKMDVTYYNSLSPVKGVVLDLGLPIPMDSGFFGLGFIYATRNSSYTKYYNISTPTTPYYLQYNWAYTLYGVRLSYHIDLLGVKHLDTYFGAAVTYVKVNWTPYDNLYYTKPPYGTAPVNASNASANPYPTISYPDFEKYGGFVGVRYDLFNFLGVFAEGSIGYANFSFGATLKI